MATQLGLQNVLSDFSSVEGTDGEELNAVIRNVVITIDPGYHDALGMRLNADFQYPSTFGEVVKSIESYMEESREHHSKDI